MAYSIRQIREIIDGRFLNETVHEHFIEHLLLDSRQLIFPERSLFFALRGKRHDGHAFIPSLYQAGVRNFVVSDAKTKTDYPGADFILVGNGLKAMQQLAAYHRRQFDIPVIGVTGSNGKTIIKEWLFQLLHEDFRIVRSPRSYNSQTGAPLSVWQMRSEHQLAVFEAGISEMGEMERLAPVIRCTIGLFTNIGDAHSGGFPSRREKIRQKLKLFEYAGVIIYCCDHEEVHHEIESLGKPTFTWSAHGSATLQIQSVSQAEEGRTLIKGVFRGEETAIRIPFSDPASVENAIHCWAVLLYLEISPAVIEERMKKLEPVAMRLELREGINGCTLINDAYNSDITSLAIALHFLEQQRAQAKHTLILSDILESAEEQPALYHTVAGLLQGKSVHRFIGIGEQVAVLREILPASIKASFYPSTNEFIRQFNPENFRDETILLKGARPFSFERIANRLARKVHQTTLEVDLNALAHNLNVYHDLLLPGVRMIAMVKASAYGSGALEVARLLEFYKVDYLAVAYADEGVDLRQGGVELPVLVLNPEEAVFDSLLRHRLEPELYSLSLLKQYAGFTAHLEGVFPIHVKLETGMNRLGFEEHHLEELTDLLLGNPQLQVRTVFTHLAAGEAPEHDAFTHEQAARFERLYEFLTDRIGYRPWRHILNSSGIVRFPEYQMEIVRLGLGLYGIDSSSEIQRRLLTVLTLRATISQIKNLAAEDTVGYGRHGKSRQGMKIATTSIGYGDGLPRASGQGKFSVLIRGRRAPIVGNVCMDMCMVDITDIPDAREGDEVVVFGKSPSVEELAEVCNTIPYEIFTGIGSRVKRVYVQE
jgi:Alr-MurF fusion protein